MKFSKDQMNGSQSVKLKPGVYDLEIVDVFGKEGTDAGGKPWRKMGFVTEVAAPDDVAGDKFIFSLFDNQFGLILDMLRANKINEADIYDENEETSDEILKEKLVDKFVTARVGVKGEYNQVTEIITNATKPKAAGKNEPGDV